MRSVSLNHGGLNISHKKQDHGLSEVAILEVACRKKRKFFMVARLTLRMTLEGTELISSTRLQTNQKASLHIWFAISGCGSRHHD